MYFLHKIFFVLGDGGYAPSPILITPFEHNSEDSLEAEFNRSFCRGRCVVESTFGYWKNIWRSLLSKERGFHYAPKTTGRIVVAAAVLHNFVKIHKYVKYFFSTVFVFQTRCI